MSWQSILRRLVPLKAGLCILRLTPYENVGAICN